MKLQLERIGMAIAPAFRQGQREDLPQGGRRPAACRIVAAVLLGTVFLVSLALNLRGTDWALLHPDEHRIAGWAEALDDGEQVFIANRVYPEGWFTLLKAIRFIDRKGEKLDERLEAWRSQGLEDVPVQPEKGKRFPIRRLRRINAWLGAFSVAFAFLALMELFGSPAAAAAGALLYAFNPIFVEHAHYAETDMMMAFMGSAAMWLLACSCRRAGSRRGIAAFLAAAFLAGGGAASKFSLAPMVLVLPANAALLARKRLAGGRAALAFTALAAAALVLAAVGFFAFTPKLWFDPSLYFSQWSRNSTLTYREMQGILGQAARWPHAAFALKLRGIADVAAACGPAAWIAVAVSLPLWFRRELRPAFCSVPLFGILYLALVPIAFPWFRSQEAIPALPFLAASAVAPLFFALRMPRRIPRIGASAAAIAILAGVGAKALVAGTRVANAFGAVETRQAMSRWLDRSALTGRKFVTEFYAVAGMPLRTLRNGKNSVSGSSKIEAIPPQEWDGIGCDYFIRAQSSTGRGNRNPFTGRLFPDRQANLDHAMEGAALLGQWSVRDGISPTFAQADVAIYASGRRGADAPLALDFDGFLFPPAAVRSQWLLGQTIRASLKGGRVGPLDAVHVIGKSTAVEFQSLPDGGKWYAVAVNHTGPGDISVSFKRGFSPRKAAIPKGGAALFVSDRSLLGLFGAVPSTQVRMRGDDHASRCTAFFTCDPAVAAALLRTFGNEADASRLAPAPQGESAAAGHAAEAIDGAGSLRPLMLCGIPGEAVGDFARVRAPLVCFMEPDTPALANYREGFLYANLPFAIGKGGATLKFALNYPTLAKRIVDALLNGASVQKLPCGLHLIGASIKKGRVVGVDDRLNVVVEMRVETEKPYAPLYLGVEKVMETDNYCEAIDMILDWNPAEAIRNLAGERMQ